MATFDQPLEAFRTRLRLEHLASAKQALKTLIHRSGVDLKANRKTIATLRQTEADWKAAKNKRAFWESLCGLLVFLTWIGLTSVVVGLLALHGGFTFSHARPILLWALFVGVGAGLLYAMVGRKQRIASAQRVAELTILRDTLSNEAWQQLAPLNALFTWDTVTDVLRQTLPDIHFDSFFSQSRLDDFVERFGWQNASTQRISVHNLQSGDIRGNPFVILKGRTMEMREQTYTGSRVVMVRKRVSDGKGRMVTRLSPEILSAAITRPIPEYFTASFVLFGSEAAPNLSFSRKPSEHSGKENTFFNRLAKRRTLKKLKAFSRNLDDEYGFTLMANHEFETLFHATDRSDEREFRLLFTPYAQQQMVALLNDTTEGYGDNFVMCKEECITMLIPNHLNESDLTLDPRKFYHYDIDTLMHDFLTFNVNYFKSCYFALAPLLTIPLYSQTRTPETTHTSSAEIQPAAWEKELIANVYGDDVFRHPECITPCILKTRVQQTGEATFYDVIAHGFKGVPRVSYVVAYDSNGHAHDVPVEWTEYKPVRQISHVILLPDNSQNPNAPSSLESMMQLLRDNGYTPREGRHIRAQYVALL